MITLEKSGKIMKVETELQASAFIANGYKRVDEAPADNTPNKDPFAQFMNEPEVATEDTETAPNAEPEPDSPAEAPKRRRRRKTE